MADISPAPSEAGAPVIVARGVHKHFGAIRAVDGVDLDIRAGELFGLIGHNGAGKSTLFRMLLGLIPATAGEIRIDGARVGGAGFRAVRRRLGYLPENVVLYDNLSGLETLNFFARLKGVPPAANAAVMSATSLPTTTTRAGSSSGRVRKNSRPLTLSATTLRNTYAAASSIPSVRSPGNMAAYGVSAFRCPRPASENVM